MWREALHCSDVVTRLGAAADGSTRLNRQQRRHAATCLRCQAEMAQYRKLLRVLHTMRTDLLQPAPGLLTDILAGLEEAAEEHAARWLPSGRRAAYVGGLAAATAAGAVSAILVAARTRRARLAS